MQYTITHRYLTLHATSTLTTFWLATYRQHKHRIYDTRSDGTKHINVRFKVTRGGFSCDLPATETARHGSLQKTKDSQP